MLTAQGHLTYCTNIHGGERWEEHFALLQEHFPKIKQQVSPDQPMGIGLRLADLASKELLQDGQLEGFKSWLADQGCYVFTMNGFPFGQFHGEVVKAEVHSPDWTTKERLHYTIRLFDILNVLLPEGMDGGISTNPLGYRHNYNDRLEAWEDMRRVGAENVLTVVSHLMHIEQEYGRILHLDIEPEPDGVLETGPEFMDWYQSELLPAGRVILSRKMGVTVDAAEEAIKKHVRLCYDVCHFALGYEDHAEVVADLEKKGIQIGKFQISAALKAELPEEEKSREQIGDAFMAFDERVYLHQVLAKHTNGSVIRFKDLPDAQSVLQEKQILEWRAHFHVPVFLADLGVLQTTQSDIVKVLDLHKQRQLTTHLEVETYTWGVLPGNLQLPVAESIARELNWVINQLK